MTRTWLVGAALALLALGLRAWGLTTANELFIDELTYARLASSAGRGEWPNLAGEAFYLHPPLAFWLNGGVAELFGLPPTPIDLVFGLRWVNAVLGAAVVALAYALLARTTRPAVAVVGALVLAADPFTLRQDSRVMLETPAFALVLAGWLVLLVGLSRASRPVLAAAGLLLGCAVLTKDIAVVPALLPVALAPLWRRTVALRDAALVVGAGLVPYAGYVVALAVAGRLPDWWRHKVGGLRRLVGLDQVTGFNADNAPSLLDALVGQLTRFGTSYVLLGLAVPAALLAVRSARADRRALGLVAVATGALGVFALAFGTLEEQMGYFVVVPGVLAAAVVHVEPPGFLARLRPVLTATALVLPAAGLGLAVVARTAADDGYRRAGEYFETALPPGSRVGVTTVTAQFAYQSTDDVRFGTWTSLGALDRAGADHVLTQSRPLGQGYGYASPDLLPWLAAHATPVFGFTGPSGGDTVVWRLDREELAEAVREGRDIPEVVSP
ncbi:ArnT family glycosyltransferase [Saccharothrix syringae]|uniref:ArnT family glycosyltransferase n=1 Tax=Saccharothrix syringae TaxID=103733 RepID=UPI000526CC73|nr:phospholipid carrier-dependent glycosyltransferase [Saccharothrix syringae]